MPRKLLFRRFVPPIIFDAKDFWFLNSPSRRAANVPIPSALAAKAEGSPSAVTGGATPSATDGGWFSPNPLSSTPDMMAEFANHTRAHHRDPRHGEQRGRHGEAVAETEGHGQTVGGEQAVHRHTDTWRGGRSVHRVIVRVPERHPGPLVPAPRSVCPRRALG